MHIQHIEIEGLITELSAGKVLALTSTMAPENRGYNMGIDRAISLIRRYGEGKGMFSVRHDETGAEVQRS